MASNRIKGITIVIGGDTTKLEKALEKTDGSLSKVQKNLKDVNRQLKLDPKNVELLDQKQRLLAQSAELTSERFKTLKKVAEESTVSNVRYEKWQKAHTALQGQITKTSNEITKLEKEGKKLEGLGFAPDSEPMKELQEKTKALQDNLKGLQQKVTDTYEELGRPISIEQWDALQREMAAAANEAKNSAEQFESFNSTLGRMGPVFSDVSDKAGKVSSALAPVSKALLGVGAAVVAAVPATEDYREAMGKLNTAFEASGYSAETARKAYEGFYQILGDTDTATEASQLLAQLVNSEEDVAKWTEIAAGVYGTFGDALPIEGLIEAANETAKVGQVTGVLADALNWVGMSEDDFNDALSRTWDEGQRAQLIMNNLGIAYGDAAEKFYENNEALIAGRDALAEFRQSMAELAALVQPFITDLTNMAASFISWFTDLPEGAKATVVAIGALVAVISPIAGIISSITGALAAAGVASKVFSVAGLGVSATLGQWVIIIGIAVAAVLALAAAIAFLMGRSKEFENMKTPDIPNYSNSMPSNVSRPRSMRTVSAQDVPFLAQGTVTRPNSPFMAVVGDNPNEPEVVSPLSTIRQAVRDEMGAGGGQPGNMRVTVNFTGSAAQLVRMLQPMITVETDRRGPQLAT